MMKVLALIVSLVLVLPANLVLVTTAYTGPSPSSAALFPEIAQTGQLSGSGTLFNTVTKTAASPGNVASFPGVAQVETSHNSNTSSPEISQTEAYSTSQPDVISPETNATERQGASSNKTGSKNGTTIVEAVSEVSNTTENLKESEGVQASQYSYVTVPADKAALGTAIKVDGGSSGGVYDDDDDDGLQVGVERYAGLARTFGSDDDGNRPFIGPQLPDIVPESLPPLEPIPEPEPEPSLPLPEPEPEPEPLPAAQPLVQLPPVPEPLPHPEPLPLQDTPVDLPYYPPIVEIPPPVVAVPIAPPPEIHSIPDYSYGYGIDDPASGVQNTKEETRFGDRTEGSYSTLLPDGRRQIVTYWVDGNSGYNAQVTYEGVAHHPVPVAEQPVYAAGHDYVQPALIDNHPPYDDIAIADNHVNVGSLQGADISTIVDAVFRSDGLSARELPAGGDLDDDLERIFDRTPIRGGYKYTGENNALCRCYYAEPAFGRR
ncbi:uncharacterized protein LOC122371866 [Amphibalanus amphitrite]|uniref:uncharacterized protein LOC122371866 n=1 Tax=Amphibalanus amphitrite TaxID=1232801 RepID=UPI001C911BD1|nr:uncharacterized protein LOC122371866 [Amphibalanus amphitrite]